MRYEVWKDITGKLILLSPDHTTSTSSLTFVGYASFELLDEDGNELPAKD